MKVSELQEKLKSVNPSATVEVIAHNRSQKFTLTIGGGDGCNQSNCSTWGFYIDGLNSGEVEGYAPVQVDWCALCCDGRIPCVCGKPAFDWQKEV